jgi:hypothetical protein
LTVWSRQRTTDTKPKIEFSAWDISDYEIIVNLEGDELSSFQNSADGSSLYNYIRVQYVDTEGRNTTRTPDDNANLQDATSITNEYRREKLLKIGKATATDADNIGRRYLTRHKDRIYKGSVSIKGYVTKKDGARVPGNRVRAGWRFYVPQLDQTFFIRYANYDAENKRLTITPDLPPDNTTLIIAELRRRSEQSEAKYKGFG